MYCKNCGRQLKDGMRFCDRCGQSVRKGKQTAQEIKRKEIEGYKEERLNRKKRLAEKETKQARKKKKGGGIIFFIVALLIAIISVLLGYSLMAPDDGGLNGGTPKPTQTANANSTTTQKPTATIAATAGASKSGYTTITIGAVSCQYPSTFKSNTTTGNEKLNLTDPLGGASMIISQEGKSGNAADLMREYARQTGGDLSYTRASDDWYAVTTTAGDTVYHRKCILKNGIAIYYDFSYSSSSSAKQKYTEYIEYIDNNFK